MRDDISVVRIEKLHPKVRATFKAFIDEAEAALNVTLRIVQGLRTIKEQNDLYAKGRTAPGKKVTNAKGGSSYHNYGLAIDLVEIKGGEANWNFKYELLKPFAEKYNLVWGGNFKSILDRPHFELTFGNHWKTLLKKVDAKDFIPGTQFANI